MKLVISERIIEEILGFAEKYGVGEPVFEELKITLPLLNLSVVFFQPERYSKLIACYLSFGGEIGFFFEDVFLAIEGRADDHLAVADKLPANVDALARNDNYVRRVLEYCERNLHLITSVPPPWFQKAVKISDAAIRKNLPELADEDLRKKQELWEAWQK